MNGLSSAFLEPFPQLDCRYCWCKNPIVYFAPVAVNGKGTCICFDCAVAKNWVYKNSGEIKRGVSL